MEGMRDHGQDETKLDLQLLEGIMANNRLAGLNVVVELLTAIHRLKTFDALQKTLEGPEHWNPYGNFEIMTTDIGLAHRISPSPPGYNPTRYYNVCVGRAIRELIPLVEEARQEVIEQKEGQEDTLPSPEEESRKLAA